MTNHDDFMEAYVLWLRSYRDQKYISKEKRDEVQKLKEQYLDLLSEHYKISRSGGKIQKTRRQMYELLLKLEQSIAT